MYYPYTAGVAALSHFYFNPLYLESIGASGMMLSAKLSVVTLFCPDGYSICD